MNDPFGIEKAAAIGAARPHGKGMGRFAQAVANRTSKPATKMSLGRNGKVEPEVNTTRAGRSGKTEPDHSRGGIQTSYKKFGAKKPRTPWMESRGDMTRTYVAVNGGTLAGVGAGYYGVTRSKKGKEVRANNKTITANSKTLSSNTRKINAHEKKQFGKSKTHLITDIGTAAAKAQKPSNAPKYIAAGSFAYGAGVMGAAGHAENKKALKAGPKRITQQQKKIDLQRAKMKEMGISKASPSERRKNTSAAITGAGVTTAGVGLLAGGVPGGKSDFAPIMNAKKGTGNTRVKRAAGTARSFGTAAAKGTPGGILGFRTSAHKGGTYGYKMQEYEDGPKKMKDSTEAFRRGRNAGKIAPEEKIIRHMKGGQKVANAALIGGAAAAAYGASRDKKIVSKSKDTRRDSALVGGGVAGAAISHGGKHALKGQQNYWETSASKDIDRAGKIAPQTAGRRQSSTPGVRTMYPSVSDGAIARNKLLDGMPKKKAEKVGRLRGSAAQGRHFAEVYGNTAKVVGRVRTPSLVVAGVGAAGLASNNKKVKKSMTTSAFGVDHA